MCTREFSMCSSRSARHFVRFKVEKWTKTYMYEREPRERVFGLQWHTMTKKFFLPFVRCNGSLLGTTQTKETDFLLFILLALDLVHVACYGAPSCRCVFLLVRFLSFLFCVSFGGWKVTTHFAKMLTLITWSQSRFKFYGILYGFNSIKGFRHPFVQCFHCYCWCSGSCMYKKNVRIFFIKICWIPRTRCGWTVHWNDVRVVSWVEGSKNKERVLFSSLSSYPEYSR